MAYYLEIDERWKWAMDDYFVGQDMNNLSPRFQGFQRMQNDHYICFGNSRFGLKSRIFLLLETCDNITSN